jgi:outer membrane protein assembly factor BamB
LRWLPSSPPARRTPNRRFRGDAAHAGAYPGEGPRQFHRVKWKFPTGHRIVSSPVYANGAIYFGGDDGNVYAVDAADGHQLWKRSTGGPVAATPTVADGRRVRRQLRRQVLRASTPAPGALRWKIATGGERRFEAKGLHGMQPKNQTIADPFDVYLSSPVLGGGSVYFGSGDGNVYAVDATTGEVKWKIRDG